MICHDDIIINTNNFWKTTIDLLSNKNDKIGWITYTNDHYYHFMGKSVSNSVREGFALDRDNKCIFECHRFTEPRINAKNIHLLDLPQKPVRCHGVFSHVMIIRSDALNDIGPCEDWSKYTLLIDEDWSLRALQKNYFNVWLPSISYTHPNPYNARRRVRDLRFEIFVHKQFRQKWGFEEPYTDEIVELVKKKYSNTNIPWSIGRKTYDWDYLS
jgi:GT2 family glycosyltransferase